MPAVAIPILPSADFDVTACFWHDFGFRENGRWVDEYLVLRHDALGIELHFWFDPGVDRWTNEVACYVRFDSPDEALACHTGWAHLEVAHPAAFSSPDIRPHGATEFHVIDLHGNLVRFGGFPPSR